MRIIDLIMEVLNNTKQPLTQGEILELIEKNPKNKECEEFSRIEVPRSAIARQLTKYSSGSKPVIRKVEKRKFELMTGEISVEILSKESDPILFWLDLHLIDLMFTQKR